MSHSIRLIIKSKSYDVINEIEDLVKNNKAVEQYALRKSGFKYCMPNGSHPHIYFPEDKTDINDDEEYIIQFESGNHCAIYDTPYSTFIAMFYNILLSELESSFIEDFEYEIWDENDDTTYRNMSEFWSGILDNDDFLKKTITTLGDSQ